MTFSAIHHAAALMAKRLEVFRAMAERAKELGGTIELQPEELFEPADRVALAVYYAALNLHLGQEPLPFREDAATSEPNSQEVYPC